MGSRRHPSRPADRPPVSGRDAAPALSTSPAGRWERHRGDLLALLIALPLVIPFLAPGWFFGHDNMHLIRLFEQDVMIHAGEFPVRWYPDVAAGYGSPHPQYYAPLFYLLAQLFLLTGMSLTASLKAAVIVVVAATSVAMYRWVRAFFGETAGLVAAAALSYAPYHMLDLFVRTAFSELTVFLFLPLVFLAFHRLAETTSPGRIAAAAAALGGLCLSHTITAMLVPPLLGGYLILEAWRHGWSRRFLLAAGGAALLGFALAAFFLVPLVAEKGGVETEIYAAAYFDYRKHFAALGQLLHSAWGFGLSREGTDDGISFRLGLLQIGGAAVAIWRRPALRRDGDRAALILFAAALSAAGIFMALGISSPVWSLVPPLRYVQFPWRFLMLPAVGLSFLCGAAAGGPIAVPPASGAGGGGAIRGKPPNGLREGALPLWGASILFLVLLVSSAEMFGFRQRIPLGRIGFGGDHTDMRERSEAEAAPAPTRFTREFIRSETLHWFDHLPRGGYPYPPKEDLSRPRAEIERGKAEVEVLSSEPARYRIRVRAAEPSLLRLNVYRFPGWTWTLDGRPAEAAAPAGKRPVLMLAIPAGDHEAEATYGRTPPRLAGDAVSLLSLGIVAALAVAAIRNRPSRP